MHYHIEWDPAKAAANVVKHGIAFEEAAFVLNDPLALSVLDDSAGDERWVTMGAVGGRLLVVIHTFEEMDHVTFNARIISARKATSQERRFYEEQR